jgi:flagellar protein FliO/FliZ
MLDIAQYLLSFGFVIGLLLALLWALKKIQSQGGLKKRPSDSRIKILETASVGARQKVMLIRLDDQDVLLGITPAGIAKLHTLEAAPSSTEEWLRRRQT